MKKNYLKSFSVILLLILLTQGCILNSSEAEGNRTQKAKHIFDIWNNSMNQMIKKFINIPFHFNYWHDAPANLQPRIEDSLFADYKIRAETDSLWSLYYKTERIYKIKRNHTSLSAVGASWDITYYHLENNNFNDFSPGYYQFTSFRCDSTILRIIHTNLGEWHLMMSEETNPKSYLDLLVRTSSLEVPKWLDNENVNIEGKGTFRYHNTTNEYDDLNSENVYNYISFETEIPLIIDKITSHHLLWKAGKINFNAFNILNDALDFKVQFLSPNKWENVVQITYKGVTDIYQENQ